MDSHWTDLPTDLVCTPLRIDCRSDARTIRNLLLVESAMENNVNGHKNIAHECPPCFVAIPEMSSPESPESGEEPASSNAESDSVESESDENDVKDVNMNLDSYNSESDDSYEPPVNPNVNRIFVGTNHQADIEDFLETYGKEGKDVEEARGGEITWDPFALPEEEVEAYLKQTKYEADESFRYSFTRGTTLHPGAEYNSNATGVQLITEEQALTILHNNKYNVKEAISEMQEKNLAWHSTKHTSVEWTGQEIALFEQAMTNHYRKFRLAQRLFVKTKTLPEIVHFFYCWKHTRRFGEWQREQIQRNTRREAALQTMLPLKEGLNGRTNDSRLRDKPRVDYSIAMAGQKTLPGYLSRDNNSRKRKREQEELVPFDIAVFADIDWDRVRAIKRAREDDKKDELGSGDIPPLFDLSPLTSSTTKTPSLDSVDFREVLNMFGVAESPAKERKQ
jgi:hypothetical protein